VGHKLAGREEVSLSDLKNEKFIFYERSQFPLMFERVTSACAEEGFIPTVVFETDNTSMMMNRVGTGEGIAVIPNFCRPLRGVVAIPIKEMPHEPSYWFWWKENTRPEVQQFVKYLQEKTFII
jgi:DNA-binding transcriptional LysR family regulator